MIRTFSSASVICLVTLASLVGCRKMYPVESKIVENELVFLVPLRGSMRGYTALDISVYKDNCSQDCAMWEAYDSFDTNTSNTELNDVTSEPIRYGQKMPALTLKTPPKPLVPGKYTFSGQVVQVPSGEFEWHDLQGKTVSHSFSLSIGSDGRLSLGE